MALPPDSMGVERRQRHLALPHANRPADFVAEPQPLVVEPVIDFGQVDLRGADDLDRPVHEGDHRVEEPGAVVGLGLESDHAGNNTPDAPSKRVAVNAARTGARAGAAARTPRPMLERLTPDQGIR